MTYMPLFLILNQIIVIKMQHCAKIQQNIHINGYFHL